MSKEAYTSCVAARMKGKKFTKEERRQAFCRSAKVCSGKAETEEEAMRLCSLPKTEATGSTCPIPIQPMAEWVKGNTKQCISCVITPVAEHYLGALEDAGETEHAFRLTKAYEGGNLLTIAEIMDRIKAAVGDTLKDKLEGFDCMGQTFE